MAANYLYGRKFPTRVLPTNNWVGGIGDYDKTGGSFAFNRATNYRNNPRELTLHTGAVKESGNVYLDLPKWGERAPTNTNTYIYDKSGNLYQRTSAGSHSLIRSVANSHGNGLEYYGEDDFLYYTSDAAIGRYGPLTSAPTFVDDYFGSQGGVPTNTYSLQLLSASSQYATAADSASLSITGDIALEGYVDPTTLPAVGSSMTVLGKWDESGTTKSYKMDVLGISGYFGDGSAGALTISVDTTDAPIDSACTGTIATTTLSATNASFAAGQIVLIHQTQGTGAGSWQRNTIQSYTAGTITLTAALNATYGTGAQVIVMKQYTDVTVNSGKTWSAKAWNGTVGGILAFLANGTVTITGTISAAGNTAVTSTIGSGIGFRGGQAGINGSTGVSGYQGEGYSGVGVQSGSANANGGGAGSGASFDGGAGGGNGTVGADTYGVSGGGVSGTSDLTTMTFGGAGGGGGNSNNGGDVAGAGGGGGGIVFITGTSLIVTGAINANGGGGGSRSVGQAAGGGGGAGGSILLKSQTATLGSSLITASGGAGGGGSTRAGIDRNGGAGGDGRIHVDYYTSYTGTTSPTLDVIQDNTLVTTTSYQLRIGISNDGTAQEYLAKVISISTAAWSRVGVSWKASTSTATFYLNGQNQGTTVGTKTAIHDNASLLYIGANKGASAVQNFGNWLTDDLRIWNTTRTDSQMLVNKDRELLGTEAGLVAYYKLNNAATDLTANANNLTLVNTPTYSINVPFSNATTRLDIDQSSSLNGQTYTTPTAIDDSTSSAKLSFVPAKDPQKSLDVNIAARGTGNWTLTIHDGLNRVILSQTVTNANLPTAGFYEWVYSSTWRPVIGQTYHAHFTSTVADGTVVTGTASNLSTATYHTYYQFLVSDTSYHPIQRMINLIAIGNERYLATYDGSTYTPMKLKFPAGYRVRSLALWREYLAIGCWKGSSVNDFDDGIIFFWDGYSQTYNFYIDVPEGAVNAMFGSRGILQIVAGYQGDILEYTGGDKAVKIKRIPKIAESEYIEVLPGGITMWKTLLRLGIAGSSNSTNLQRGAYSWGSANKGYPDSLSLDYPISTGNYTNTVTVGMLFPVGGKLLMGWGDGTGFGVDVIDPASGPPADSGTVEDFIIDIGAVWKEKKLPYVRADFKTLRTGETVTIKYKLDRATSWTTKSTSTVGATSLRLPVVGIGGSDRHKEAQIAVDLAQTGGTAPTLLEASQMENFLLTEEQGIE